MHRAERYTDHPYQPAFRRVVLMSRRLLWFGLFAILVVGLLVPVTAQGPAPEGFTSLFNGKDLNGWRGRPGGGGVFSPYVEATFTPEERAAKQKEWNADRDLHWSVDTSKGEIVSDGKGVHLATEKAYGDFELWVDWMLVHPGGDSGIYLRDYPQVQASILVIALTYIMVNFISDLLYGVADPRIKLE